jgi:hypothetical protein
MKYTKCRAGGKGRRSSFAFGPVAVFASKDQLNFNDGVATFAFDTTKESAWHARGIDNIPGVQLGVNNPHSRRKHCDFELRFQEKSRLGLVAGRRARSQRIAQSYHSG